MQSAYQEWEQLEKKYQQAEKLWSVPLASLRKECERIEKIFLPKFLSHPRTDLDHMYAKRCQKALEELSHVLERRTAYARIVRMQVSNKGNVEDHYEVLRQLGETTLGGHVVLARHRRTKRLVAIKRSPLHMMCRCGKEFPLHETTVYRIFQRQAPWIPHPGWFLRLSPYQREGIQMRLTTAFNLPKEKREATLRQLKEKMCAKLHVSSDEANQLIKYYFLLSNCQEFFAQFGQYRNTGGPPLLGGGGGGSGEEKKASSINRSGHQHIAQFIEDFADEQNHYMVLELCNGGDFFAFVQKHRGISNQTMCGKFFVQLLSAVSHMHRLGLYHLDLSLEQMMISESSSSSSSSSSSPSSNQPDRELKLIDFGMTRFRLNSNKQSSSSSSSSSSPSDEDKKHTSSSSSSSSSSALFPGTNLGKPGYKPPEMWQKRPFDGEKVDVFCMGVILALMSLGWPPFQTSLHKEYFLVARGKLRGLMGRYGLHRQADAYTNSGLLDLITRMLAEDFTKRPTLAQIIEHPWVARYGAGPLLNELKSNYQQKKQQSSPEKKSDKSDMEVDDAAATQKSPASPAAAEGGGGRQ